jgi:MerR family transcriptional regulator, light-induced transcriptional regulator
VRTLKTGEAAALLNVSPNTLRGWERRFGYPRAQRPPGKHRLYTQAEITELRDALSRGLSISSAVGVAQESLRADAHSLASALKRFCAEDADVAMESSLAIRSLERSVEEVLLPSLDEIGEAKGHDSATWAFSLRWAHDWLQRARRVSPVAPYAGALLIGDASRGELDPAIPYIVALELFCIRAGASVLTLSVEACQYIREAVSAFPPDAVVLAGNSVADDDIAAWAYAVRSTTGPLPFVVYHRRVSESRSSGRVLARMPAEAQAQVFELFAGAGWGAERRGKSMFARTK